MNEAKWQEVSFTLLKVIPQQSRTVTAVAAAIQYHEKWQIRLDKTTTNCFIEKLTKLTLNSSISKTQKNIFASEYFSGNVLEKQKHFFHNFLMEDNKKTSSLYRTG